LRIEAKEQAAADHPLLIAASHVGMDKAFERMCEVWPRVLNARNSQGDTPIMLAVRKLFSLHTIHLLATMGADLSFEDLEREGGNVFDLVGVDKSPTQETRIYALLAEHGVTSNDIPFRFQSPLYFASPHYIKNLKQQRWIVRRTLMMCMNCVFNWSLANQIESERLMTLPPDLSSIGLLVAKCWMHVDAYSVSNGIARLIMQFSFGFNSDRNRLVGMPREEAELDDDEEERQRRIEDKRIYAADRAERE
jgi:hypothetical protein